jgi:hypothetical protein
MNASLPKTTPSARDLDEARALRTARRNVRRCSWVLGLAIFFSLAPFSFHLTAGKAHWLLTEAPGAAAVYGLLGVASWIVYVVMRQRAF